MNIKRVIISVVLIVILVLSLAGCQTDTSIGLLEGKWKVEKKVFDNEDIVPEIPIYFVITESGAVSVYADENKLEDGQIEILDDDHIKIVQEEIATEYEYTVDKNKFEFWHFVTDSRVENAESRTILERVEN